MNKSPLLKFIFDRKHIATGEKEAPVELRVTGDYKQIYFDLGVKLTKRQWNQNAAQVVNRPDAAELNLTLEKFLRNVRQVINDMLDEGNVDMKAIRDRLKRKQTGVVSFIDFCDRRSKERKFNLSKDSKERYDRFMKKFVEWGGIEFEDETTINFEDIPTELLDELVQKTPLIRKVTLEQFEDDWYQQKAGCVAIRKINN